MDIDFKLLLKILNLTKNRIGSIFFLSYLVTQNNIKSL